MDKRIVTYLCTGYYSAVKKNELLIYAMIWMNVKRS